MQKMIKLLSAALVVSIIGITLVACGKNKDTMVWLSPTIGLTVTSDHDTDDYGVYMAGFYGAALAGNNSNTGASNAIPNATRTFAYDSTKAKAERITVATGAADSGVAAVEVGRITTAGITSAVLENNGAVKTRLDINYGGKEEIEARVRVLVSRIAWDSESEGWAHDPQALGGTNYSLVALMQHDGKWWNVRTTAIGGLNTGGVPADPEDAVLEISKGKLSYDIFLVGLSEGLYVVNFVIEAPDWAEHYHGINVIAQRSMVVEISDETSPWTSIEGHGRGGDDEHDGH